MGPRAVFLGVTSRLPKGEQPQYETTVQPKVEIVHTLWGRLWRTLGEKLVQLFEKLALALGANHAFHRLAVLKHDERGDAHDLKATGDFGVVVHVQFGNLDLAGLLDSNLVEDRGNRLARPAPLRPEVDEHGFGRSSDLLIEVGIGE